MKFEIVDVRGAYARNHCLTTLLSFSQAFRMQIKIFTMD